MLQGTQLNLGHSVADDRVPDLIFSRDSEVLTLAQMKIGK